MKKTTLALAIAAALSVQGCAIHSANKNVSIASEKADTLKNQVGAVIQGAGNSSPVMRYQGAWIPAEKRERIIPLGAREQAVLSRKITLNSNFHDLSAVAEKITQLTGVVVHLAPDAKDSQPAGALMSAAMMAGQPVMGQTAGQPMQEPGVTLTYSGALSGLMDSIAARFDVNWEYRDGKFTLYRMTSKTFVLKAIAGDAGISTKISNVGLTSSGTSSSSTNETSLSASNLSIWKSVEEGIKAMLSTGGKVVVTPSIGTVTVNDTPDVIRKVGQYIEQQNAHISRQVTVNVEVLSVTLDDTAEYGIDWDAVNTSINGVTSASLSNSFQTTLGAPTITIGAIQNESGTRTWAGSKAIIKALSKQGRVSVATSATAVTMNNQPVPVQVGKQTSYLASSSTTTTANVGTTTTLTSGTVSTGFSMTVLPHIIDGKNLLLQYAVDFSNLVAINSVSSGDSSIQVPEVETRNFMQRVSVNSGETLVLAGFEQNASQTSKSGVGSANNPLFGGVQSGNKNKNIIVILVRPVLDAAI